MAMSKNISEYVGKTFSYMLGIQNIVCIVVVLGFEKKGERFDGDSYYGKRILISKTGHIYDGDADWCCEKIKFEKMDKIRIR